jgi:hypothetical protein
MSRGTIAFALGGLAGNNAHGAGFLQAALDHHVEPAVISCTSGQILWLYRYVQCRAGKAKLNLREQLREDIHSVRPTGNVNMDLAILAMMGKPDVFRPAGAEFFCDLMQNACDTVRHVCTDPQNTNWMQEWLELFPCRLLVPQFPADFYRNIAGAFCDETLPIGIMFNSYNPRSGDEYVYMNEQAREQLHHGNGRERRYDPGQPSRHRDRTTYQDITPQAVEDGLWLYQYGFDQGGSDFVDGAYFRGVILSELGSASTIYSVRPVNHCWQGHLPRNYPELEDLKTEIGFDGAYCGERSQILLINRLLRERAFSGAHRRKYHHVQLEEIEIERPRGYFDYLFESEDVFEDAYQQAMKCFRKGIGARANVTQANSLVPARAFAPLAASRAGAAPRRRRPARRQRQRVERSARLVEPVANLAR